MTNDLKYKDEELARAIGQLLVVGFDGHTPNEKITSLITEYYVGTVILFIRNVKDAQQVLDLTNSLQDIAKKAGHKYPLFISIDQENGLVSRIVPPLAPQFPGSMTLGATGNPDDGYKVNLATAKYLRAYGIQSNYAPVADINSNPKNPVVGVRSFGDDPHKVADFVDACAKGLTEGEVLPCVKHFPGHGDTAIDSHHGTALIEKSLADLENCELVPFRKCKDVDSLMMGHVILPALGDRLPASVSPAAYNFLREEIGYEKFVVTDCLEMDAISVPYTSEKGAAMALSAGADSIMVCHQYKRQTGSFHEMYHAVIDGRVSRDQVLSSLAKIEALKEKYHLSWRVEEEEQSQIESDISNDEQLAFDIYSRSVTALRNDGPRLKKGDKVAFILPNKPKGNVASGAVNLRTDTRFIPPSFDAALSSKGVEVTTLGYDPEDEITIFDEQIASVDSILVITRNASLLTYQQKTVNHLMTLNKPLSVIAVDVPYDFMGDEYKDLLNNLCVYEPTVEAFKQALSVLFGEHKPTGVSPVKL